MKLDVNGQQVEIDDSFVHLSPEEQESTVNDIAKQLGIVEKKTGSEALLKDLLGEDVLDHFEEGMAVYRKEGGRAERL